MSVSIVRDEAPERGFVRPLLERDREFNLVKPSRDRLGTRLSSGRAGSFSRSREFAGGISGAGIDVSQAITPGVRPDVVGIYMLKYSHLEAKLNSFAMRTVPMTSREEILAYPKSSPYPSRQDRGRGPKIEGTDYTQFRIRAYAWALRMGIHVDDIDDDRTGSAMQVLRKGAEHFATLPERIFIQMITGSTDAELLPSIPTAPDGAAMYATTAGGVARFGVTNGNLLTGTSSPVATDLREQAFEVSAQFRQFLDTKGQPLFDPSIIDEGAMVIVYGPAIEREMLEAHKQSLTLLDNPAAGTAGTSAATISNIITEAGRKFILYNTPRITTNDCYYFIQSDQIERPILHGIRRDLYTVTATEETSDAARDTNTMFEQSRTRQAYRTSLPYATIKVDNS